MRSSDHKAEAERLLLLARTDEGKREDDPGDPLVLLQLARVHAILAVGPDEDDLVDAELVVDEHDLLADASDLALTATLQARTLWTAAQWGNLMLIARDTREAIVLTKTQLEVLRGRLEAGGEALPARAKATLDEWLAGFDA